MKNILSVCLLIAGLIFLGVGYSAPSRAKAKELDAMLNDNGASGLEKVLRAQREGEAAAKQQEAIDELNRQNEKRAYETRATIQYCTGWLLVAASGIVFVSSRKEKLK